MKLILSILLTLAVTLGNAATITGNLADVSELALSPRLVFTPQSTPLAHTNGSTILDTTKTVNVTNGAFSVRLVGGYYTTSFGPFSKDVNIYVPFNDTNTYGFNYVASLATNVPNYVRTNWSYLISQHVVAGGGITLTTNSPNSANEALTITSTGGGIAVAQGTNIVLVTNGGTVTIHGTAAGGGSSSIFSNTNLAVELGLITNGTGVALGTNTSHLARVTNGEWALFGYGFDGGQGGWPPIGAVEKAFPLFSTDGIKWSGGGRSFNAPNGNEVRNNSLIKVGGIYAWAISAHNALEANTNFPLSISTNLAQWSVATNLHFAMAGDGTPVAYAWTPVLTQVGTNIWMTASVSTNGGSTFQPRIRTCPVATFPMGWEDPVQLNNSTTRTNIIDGFFFVDGANLWLWYKNEQNKYVELGQLASQSPSAVFTHVLTNDHSGWGLYRESPWMVRKPDGTYLLGMMRYQREGLDGLSFAYAMSSSIASGWGGITNMNTPLAMQGIIPMVCTTLPDVNAAMAASSVGPLEGTLNIDRATLPPAVNFGDQRYTRGGIFANTNNSTVGIYVPSTAGGDQVTNAGIYAYAKLAVEYSNNAARFPSGTVIYGNGSGLSNVTATAATGITNNQNAETSFKVMNASTGASAYSMFALFNGTGSTEAGLMGVTGTGWGISFGAFLADSFWVLADTALTNGMAIGSTSPRSSTRIYAGANTDGVGLVATATNKNFIVESNVVARLGGFIGNGSGLTNLQGNAIVSPLTLSGPTPSANLAGVVMSNGVVSGITRPVRGIYNAGITAGSTNYMALNGMVSAISSTPSWVAVNFVNRQTTLTNLAMFWNLPPNTSQFFRVTIFTNSIANIGTGVATDLSVLITNSSSTVYAINPSNSVVVPSNCWYSAQIITSSGATASRPSLYVEEMP